MLIESFVSPYLGFSLITHYRLRLVESIDCPKNLKALSSLMLAEGYTNGMVVELRHSSF